MFVQASAMVCYTLIVLDRTTGFCFCFNLRGSLFTLRECMVIFWKKIFNVVIYTVSVGTAVQVGLAFVLFLFGHLRLYHDWGVPVAPSCFYIITKTTNIQINSLSVQVYIKAFISTYSTGERLWWNHFCWRCGWVRYGRDAG